MRLDLTLVTKRMRVNSMLKIIVLLGILLISLSSITAASAHEGEAHETTKEAREHDREVM